MELQSGAAYHLLGFEDESLGSSPGWWAATVATYFRLIGRPALYNIIEITKEISNLYIV